MNTSGLIFSQEQRNTVREYRETAPFAAAWDKFASIVTLNPAEALNYGALRWRLLDDGQAAENAAPILDDFAFDAGDAPVIDACRQLFAVCQALACLADHPALTDSRRALAHAMLAAALDTVRSREAGVDEQAWVALAVLSTGVVTGDNSVRDSGAQAFREIIDMVVPHGYILPLVEAKDDGSLARTVKLAHALALAAEVGEHAGLNLWTYEHRGVSVMTAALYPLYYYYYPEKWPWKANSPFEIGRKSTRLERAKHSQGDVELEPTQAVFQQHAAYLELVNRRTPNPVRAVTLILDELRPITDLLGGGAVTLTHALPPPPKRRGLFGR